MSYYEEQEYTKSFDLSLWNKLLSYAGKYKKAMFVLVLAQVLIALADTSYPMFTRYAFDTFVAADDMSTFPIYVCLNVGVIVIQCFLVFVFIKLAGYIQNRVMYDVRQRGFLQLQKLSFSYYDTTAVGWMMARMTSDAGRIGDILGWGLPDLFWAGGYLVFVVISMFLINPFLALMVLIAVPVLIVISIFIQLKILKGHRIARKINSKITGAYNEGINGAKTTKTLLRERKNHEEFMALTEDMRRANVRVSMISAFYMPVVLSLGSVGIGLTLVRGGYMATEQVISIGTLALFLSYAQQVFEPIRQIAAMVSEMQSAQASAERTFSLIETEPDIVDREDVLSKYGDALTPKRENWENIHGDIEFRDVTFRYKTGEEVLSRFNLKVARGEKIALVGETGAGKSTIVNLICRFYEPTDGQILIDGKDYRERSQIWLQSNLGYVLQTPHLFSGTVMENIRYSNLDATDEQVIEAAKTVNAYDFIMRLENGFQTDVGEGGNRLSTGEKQLVSFARAILSNPRLFILDEATSSIDTETEKSIQQAVYRVLEGRTSFIVAHRLSTIRTCDKILVLSDGKIIEGGSHKELMALRGHYYNLYTNQFKEEKQQSLLNN